MATGQGDRAGQQAHQRVEAQCRGKPDAHGILYQQKAGHHEQEDGDDTPTLFQAGKVCA
ncbi:hypothetical protein D3C77_798690 [compost metagenome]